MSNGALGYKFNGNVVKIWNRGRNLQKLCDMNAKKEAEYVLVDFWQKFRESNSFTLNKLLKGCRLI